MSEQQKAAPVFGRREFERAHMRASGKLIQFPLCFPAHPKFSSTVGGRHVVVMVPDGEELLDPDEDSLRVWMRERADFRSHRRRRAGTGRVQLSAYWVSASAGRDCGGLSPAQQDERRRVNARLRAELECEAAARKAAEEARRVPILNAVAHSGWAERRPLLPMFARIDCETGEEIMALSASMYDGILGCVKVDLPDERCLERWVWLRVADIRVDESRPVPGRQGHGW